MEIEELRDMLSQLAPSIGELFKLLILTLIAITIALMVVSMANAYESTVVNDYGFEAAESDVDDPW